ncbi:MAG: SH3 domain-containing protein [Spirochaetes bacterium]|nr:SH3 domain-containing protein [Spirochaetota bacterium]
MKPLLRTRIIVPILFLSLLMFHCGDGKSIPEGSYAIILQPYTPLRIDPFVFSGTVLEMRKGATVQIIDTSAEKSWVERSHDYWYRVKTGEGITGWVFGTNISIHSSSDSDAMEKIVTGFMEAERARVKQYLAGKWWTTNEFGDFTDHCLELYESQKYRSFQKGGEAKPIVGTFTIDFTRNEILFSDGTSFKSNLDLEKRGSDFIIKREMKDFELRFKKISIETGPEPVIKEKKDSKQPTPPAEGNTAQ